MRLVMGCHSWGFSRLVLGMCLIVVALFLFPSVLNGQVSPGDSSGFDTSDFVETVMLRHYNTRLVVLGTSLLGVASGLVGTFLLLRKRSLLGDALSHATLPGIVLAFYILVRLGEPGKNLAALLLGAGFTGIGGVFLVLLIRRTTRLKDDAAMGIVLSVFFGAGVAMLSMVQTMPEASAAGLESFITGKTASMIWSDFLLIGGVCLISILCSQLFLKELTLLCFDEGFAASQGWPVLGLDLLMVGMVGAVTIVGLQSVGLILVIAFLIIPSTAARFWTHDLKVMLILSGVIGGFSGWIGASLSALFSKLPAGAVIVLVSAGIFGVSLIFGPAKGVFPKWMRHRRLSSKVGRQHLLRAVFEILEDTQDSQPGPVRNYPVQLDEVVSHRSWSRSEVVRLAKKARRLGYMEPPRPGHLGLSESGFGEASRVTRNHRLWEHFMIRFADIAPSHVDRDADMVEHVLGPEIVRQLEDELAQMEASTDLPPSPHEVRSPQAQTPAGESASKSNSPAADVEGPTP